jgi:sugar phosphate isomerase/epimerase
MQLGFVSAVLPDSSFREVMTTAAKIGYDVVEIMCWPAGKAERRYAGVTHIDVDALDDEAVGEIRSILAETGVGVSGLGYYPNPLSPNPEEAEVAVAHLRKVMAAAARLGVRQVNTFVGRDFRKSIDDNWPRMLEVWRPLARTAEELGIRIGVENCPMLFSKDEWPGGKNLFICPAVWRRFFEDVPSPNLGMNYDPSHLIWQFIDPVPPIYEFRDRIFHVHAKDARVDRGRLQDLGVLNLDWHTPKLPGMGDCNWGAFFGALTDVKYDGAVCVEVEDRAFEGSLADRKRSLVQSRRFLSSFVVKPAAD